MEAAGSFLERKIKLATPFLVYLGLYLISFHLIESKARQYYTVIETELDHMIPFCEIFVIPYLLWFVYSFLLIAYIFFTDEEAYQKICIWYMIGMTLFIVVSVVFPNIQMLRPIMMPRDNVFTHLVRLVYASDTPTNLTPSIHAYNSLGMMTIIAHSRQGIFARKWVRGAMEGFGGLIILSTMLIKQHSVLDVLTAIVLGVVVTRVLYPAEARATGKLKLSLAARK